MIAVYAMPVSVCNPDAPTERARIDPARLAYIDRRHGRARNQSFAASLLLDCAAEKCFPWAARPLEITLSANGKPCSAAYPNIHFSLSHSKEWAACAVSDAPVGVDIQFCGAVRRNLADRFFHPDEARYIREQPPADREETFFALWTLKESFMKAAGGEDTLSLDSFCVDLLSGHVFVSGIQKPYSVLRLPFLADNRYQVGLCVREPIIDLPKLEIIRVSG